MIRASRVGSPLLEIATSDVLHESYREEDAREEQRFRGAGFWRADKVALRRLNQECDK